MVYDSVGKDTWRGSLSCLKPFGMFANFGQSSGMIEDFKLSDLAEVGRLRPVALFCLTMWPSGPIWKRALPICSTSSSVER